MKRRLLTLLLTLVFCVTSVAPGFAMNADDLGGAVPAASAVWIVWKMMFMVLLPATLF